MSQRGAPFFERLEWGMAQKYCPRTLIHKYFKLGYVLSLLDCFSHMTKLTRGNK